MKKTTYILKKDLPTIKAGRIIELSKDGNFGAPILMTVEEENTVNYIFPINILNNENEWFELFEYDTTKQPISIQNSIDKCSRCDINDEQSEHVCPYYEEINKDSDSLCNCCSDCENKCRNDI